MKAETNKGTTESNLKRLISKCVWMECLREGEEETGEKVGKKEGR